MTPREEIFRKGLKRLSRLKSNDDIGNTRDEIFSWVSGVITDTIKEADEIKDTHPSGDGPSEGDKERLQNIASMALDSIFWKDIEWLISNNKKYMGIE